MEHQTTGQVAVLIDFENLVRGLHEDDDMDCEVLFRLAEEYGRVLVANAYADWRMKDVNRYQTDLYRLGVELVHVFGKGWGTGYKNAVDVKMAVDAISAISTLPHINVFVIVSGDRDFIHVLKALRRHGKIVIGVSPESSASEDFAALCDRFTRYEALVRTYNIQQGAAPSPAPAPEDAGLEAVREALRVIVAGRPGGILGANIKPLLRRQLSPSFDESTYGYSRLTEMLDDMVDVVQVVASESGGDVLVYPADSEVGKPSTLDPADQRRRDMVRRANLTFYRFDPDAARRRRVLQWVFQAVEEAKPLSWDQVQDRVLAESTADEVPMTSTALFRLRTLLYQSRVFWFERGNEDLPHRARRFSFVSRIASPQDLIEAYEQSVVYKLAEAAGGPDEVSPELVAGILGLPSEDDDALEYCRGLIGRLIPSE